MPKLVKTTSDVQIEPVDVKDGPALPPEFEAFSVVRVAGGWSFIRITLTSDMVVESFSSTPPDVKGVTTEAFKIAVGKKWMRE